MAKTERNPSSPWPEIDPDVVCRRMGEATVLVHLGTDRILTLNHTGSRLFELLREGVDRAEIHRRVTAEYEIEPAELDRELDRLVGDLRRLAVLVDGTDG